MIYDAEDKYADIIHLPLLAFFKKCEKILLKTPKNVKISIKKSTKNVKIIDNSL